MHIFSLSKILLSLISIFLFLQPTVAQKRAAPRQTTKRSTPQKVQIAESVIAELSEFQPLKPEKEDVPEVESNAENKPPADEAKLDKILAYWRDPAKRRNGKFVGLTDVVRQRIFEASLNRPALLPQYLQLIPDTSAAHDQLYRLSQELPDMSADEFSIQPLIKNYLKNSSQYFREELLAEAQEGGAVVPLARLDWDAAKPIIERYLLEPTGSIFHAQGLALTYEHALKIQDRSLVDSTLKKLKEIVTNPNFEFEVRRFALQGAMTDKWDGQQEWFLSLFSDATLSGMSQKNISNNNSVKLEEGDIQKLEVSPVRVLGSGSASGAAAGAAAAVRGAGGSDDPNNFYNQPNVLAVASSNLSVEIVEKIIRFVGNPDPTIHNAAVRFLVEFNQLDAMEVQANPEAESNLKKEIARKLMPWLQNPTWSIAPGREGYLGGLGDVNLRECVLGLIAILTNEEDEQIIDAASRAIRPYKEINAVPALKRQLQQAKTEYGRENLVTTIALANGFSDAEMAAAYEVYVRKASTEKGEEELMQAIETDKLLPLKLSIGKIFFESEEIPATDGLLQIIFARVKEIRRTQPAVAQKMLAGIQRVPFRIAQLNLIERLRDSDVDAVTISYLLEDRKDLQKHVGDSVYPILSQGGYNAGIASVILSEAAQMQEILTGKDVKAQLALLVCAYYVREKLAVADVAQLLSVPTLTQAAENYLELENSTAARNILWARHPNQAWVVGEKAGFDPGQVSAIEEKLQKEILGSNGVEEIYAVLHDSNRGNLESVIVRVKKDAAQVSLTKGNGYRKYRELTNSEWQELKYLTAQSEVEDLAPEMYESSDESEHYSGPISSFEYLRLKRENGRRIMLSNLSPTPKREATLHEQLAGLFYEFSHSGEFKIRYDIEDKIKGLEVLWSDKKQKLLTVAQEAKELRVLMNVDYSAIYRKKNSDDPLLKWRVFEAGQLGAVANTPALFSEYFSVMNTLGAIPRNEHSLGPGGFSVAGQSMYFVMPSQQSPGIVKFSAGMTEPVKVSNQIGSNIVVSSDEKWLVLRTISLEEDKPGASNLLRINLENQKEFIVKVPPATMLTPRAYLPDRKQVFLASDLAEQLTTGYLLDPETGKLTPVKGEFRPILNRVGFPLQPTAKPYEYWVMLKAPDQKDSKLGRYSTQDFTFTPVMELPDLSVEAVSFWVDETASQLYFVHDGNLLRILIPKK